MDKEKFILASLTPKYTVEWASTCDPKFVEIMRENPEKRVMLVIFESVNTIVRYLLDLTVEQDKKVLVTYCSKTNPVCQSLAAKFPGITDAHDKNPDSAFIAIGCGTPDTSFQFFSCTCIDITGK